MSFSVNHEHYSIFTYLNWLYHTSLLVNEFLLFNLAIYYIINFFFQTYIHILMNEIQQGYRSKKGKYTNLIPLNVREMCVTYDKFTTLSIEILHMFMVHHKDSACFQHRKKVHTTHD